MLDQIISNAIWIQCFGAIGYALFAFSGLFKKRSHILTAECIGCAIIGTQWLLLGAPAAAWIHFVYIYAALSGLAVGRFRGSRHLPLLSIPFSAALILYMGDGTSMDFWIFVASLPGFCAKYFQSVLKLRVLSMVGAILWLIVNVSLGSVPGILCSFGFLFSHGYSCARELNLIKDTKSLSPAV